MLDFTVHMHTTETRRSERTCSHFISFFFFFGHVYCKQRVVRVSLFPFMIHLLFIYLFIYFIKMFPTGKI